MQVQSKMLFFMVALSLELLSSVQLIHRNSKHFFGDIKTFGCAVIFTCTGRTCLSGADLSKASNNAQSINVIWVILEENNELSF